MVGYHRNRRATKNTVKEGWLHTGDVARYREDGQFIIVDRLKELIKVKGHQVRLQRDDLWNRFYRLVTPPRWPPASWRT